MKSHDLKPDNLVTFNASRKNSLWKHVIRDRTKRGRVERKKEGDRRAERQKFIQTQWVTQPSGHLGWDVESASCLPHSEGKKKHNKKPFPTSAN